ncbi:MAG: sensor protein [Gemmatimonadetes bacterium]|nr:sensor protein [Gemmatimonadota bacterium]
MLRVPNEDKPRSPVIFGEAAKALAPLLEHVRDACIFVDDEMRIGFLNLVARRDQESVGIDPDKFPGSSLWDLLGYTITTPARVAVEEAARDRVPTHFTTRGTHGAYWIEVDVSPMETGGCLIYYRDATFRSTAAEAKAESDSELRMTSERLRVLIDEAPLAVLVIDNDSRVLHWNPEAEKMFLWKAEEVVGKPLPLIPDDERESYDKNLEFARTGGSLKANPARRQRKDGVVLDVQVSSSPMRDRGGVVTGAIVMVSDVTAHRKLETQLRMAQKMEAVGLLAGGVAHDFNNLLTAIKGFTSLLQMTLDENDASAEFLGEINKAADRAAALTAQLLAFSRRQLLRPEALDLNGRVRDLDRMLRLLLRDDGELTLELSPELNQVLADPGQIEQVILNLVVNARDAIHGRTNGVVSIRTSNAVLDDEFAQWGVNDVPGPYVRLDVVDNGVGMDRATQARIFDPFFTTKEAGQGTGLGLATVFGIVKQSGGYVWVESAPGKGSAFSVYLPRAQAAVRVSGPSSLAGAKGNETILLVEDEEAVRRVARRALEMHGYKIVDAADAVTALVLAAANEVDLVLSDVMMPGMPGPTMVEELRRRDPDVRVLFMSGHTEEIIRDGLLDPSTPFLAKPFTPTQLAQKVREALDAPINARR